jgi:hypothetical protein
LSIQRDVKASKQIFCQNKVTIHRRQKFVGSEKSLKKFGAEKVSGSEKVRELSGKSGCRKESSVILNDVTKNDQQRVSVSKQFVIQSHCILGNERVMTEQ